MKNVLTEKELKGLKEVFDFIEDEKDIENKIKEKLKSLNLNTRIITYQDNTLYYCISDKNMKEFKEFVELVEEHLS